MGVLQFWGEAGKVLLVGVDGVGQTPQMFRGALDFMSATVESLIELMQSTVFPIGGSVILGGIFVVIAAIARAAWLSNRATVNRIWLPVQPALAASPSPADVISNGIRAAFRAIGAFVVMIVCFYAGFDLILFQGQFTLTILLALGF